MSTPPTPDAPSTRAGQHSVRLVAAVHESRRRPLVGAAVAVALLAAGCSSIDSRSNAAEGDDADVVLPPTTKVLDDDTLDALEAVNGTGTLTFAVSTGLVGTLEEGDVVVAGVSAHTPGGLMRKVETVTEREGAVVVTTEVAALDEAIDRAHIQHEHQVDLGDADLDHPATRFADGVELVDGGAVRRGEHEGTEDEIDDGSEDDGSRDEVSEDDEGAFADRMSAESPPPVRTVQLAAQPSKHTRGGASGNLFALNDVVLHDGADGRVTASGSFSFEARPRIVLDIDESGLNEFTVNLDVTEGVTLRLDATGTATLREDVTIAVVPLGDVVFTAGPLPVVISLRLDVVVTADGSITAEMHSSVAQTASASVGFGWRDGGFDAFADSDSDFEFDAPTFSGAATAKVAVGGRLSLCLYTVFCAYAQGDGFVGVDASPAEPPTCVDWALSGGIEAKVGVDLPLIVAHVKEDATVLEERSELDRYRCAEDAGTGGGGQRGGVPWARSYSGDRGAAGNAIETTRDGGSIVAGGASFSSSFGGGNVLWVVKLDAVGDIEWEYQYFGAGAARAVRETDGGYYVAASNGEVLKLDRRGRLRWARRYTVNDDNGHPVGVAAEALQVMSDGGAVVAANALSATTSYDIVLVKIAQDGDVQWSRRFGGPGSETVGGLALGADGGMLVAGASTGSFSSQEHAWALHLRPDGSVVWQKQYLVDWTTTGNGFEPTKFDAAEVTPDGGFVVGGRIGGYRYSPFCDRMQIENGACDGTGSVGGVGWVMRLDAGGSALWSTAQSMGTLNDEISAVTFAGSAVVAAGSKGLGDEQDVWAVQFGGDRGEIGWSRIFGGPRYDTTAPLILGGGSQYVDAGGSGVRIVGTSNSLSDHSELWVLDLTLTGQLDFTDDRGVQDLYWNGLGIPLLTATGPTGDKTVSNRSVDTDTDTTDPRAESEDLTNGIEVATTRARVRTQAGG